MTPIHHPAARRLLAAGLFLSGLLVTLDSVAGSFNIEPVKVSLSPANRTEAVRIRNTQDQEITVQVETFAWSQRNGEDRLTPTRTLLAMPPVVTLPPDAEQIVRVGLQENLPETTERAYRLHFREIPPPGPPAQRGLRVALKISIPVFTLPAEDVAPDPGWHARLRGDGKLLVRAENDGNGHLRIARLEIRRPGDDQLLAGDHGLTYVLPGNSHKWILTPRQSLSASPTLQVITHNNGRTTKANLALE